MGGKTLDELVGKAKESSDFTAHQSRLRYTASPTVSHGNLLRMTLAKFPSRYIDMRSLHLRFQMFIDSEGARVDAPTIASIFDRVVVKCGSRTLMDINEYGQIATQLEVIEASNAMESSFNRRIRGHGTEGERNAWGAIQKEYLVRFLKGSFLNCESLLPLERISDIHIEIYLASGSKCLYKEAGFGGVGEALAYHISEIELHSTYLASASLDRYFSSSQLQFTVTDYSHRFANITGRTALVEFSSANTSLNSTLSFFHYPIGSETMNRWLVGVPGLAITDYQVFVNNVPYYDQPVDSIEQMWRHFVSAFPRVCKSTFFDDYNTNFLLVNNLAAAPSEYQSSVVSGVRTSALNSNVVLKLEFGSAQALGGMTCDSFLLSDAIISLTGGKGDLQIRN